MVAIPSFLLSKVEIALPSLASLSALVADHGVVSPSFPAVYQPQGTEWCWAACACAIHAWYDGPQVNLCSLVTSFRPGNDCCADPLSIVCAAGGDVAQALQSFGNLRPPGEGALSLDDIRPTISTQNRPLVCVLTYPTGSHAVILFGWGPVQGKDSVAIMDPQAGMGWIAYAQFRQGYPSNGFWSDTYRTGEAS